MGTDLIPYKSPAQKANEKNLIPFRPGHDGRRGRSTGRPSYLDNPDFFDLLVKGIAGGAGTKDLAQAMGIGEKTMRIYKRDPRVVVAVKKLMEERVLEITRRIDSQIHRRLNEADKMDTETLLKIRKEFLGGVFRQQVQGGKDDPGTIGEATHLIENNPDLAAELMEMLSKASSKASNV